MFTKRKKRALQVESLESRLTMATYLNEILYSPLFGNQDQDQYIELRSDNRDPLAAGTYLVVLNNSSIKAGKIHTVFDLSNQTFGSNGYLVLAQQGNRYTFHSDARVLQGTTTGFTGIGGGGVFSSSGGSNHIDSTVSSSSFLLIQSSVKPNVDEDIDSDNNGVPDGAWSSWTILDGAAINFWVDGGSGQWGYAPIVFRDRASGSSTVAQTMVDVEQIAIVARLGDSTGYRANDWVSANVTEFVSGGGADYRMTHGTFGTPRPRFMAGRALDNIGSSNWVGMISGNVWQDENRDGVKQPTESGIQNAVVYGDQNNNGVYENVTYAINPSAHPDDTELTNVGQSVTLTVAGTDNLPLGFVVKAVGTPVRKFAHERVDFFSTIRRMRMDFYQPAKSVSILFTGTSVFTPTYGRLEAFDAAGNSLGFLRTSPLPNNANQQLTLDFPDGRIAWAVAYCDDDYLSSNPFGKLDTLQYVIPEPKAVTDTQGNYSIRNLADGAYRVRSVPPTGMILQQPVSGSHAHTVLASSSKTNADFVYAPNRAPLFSNQSFAFAENSPNLMTIGNLVASELDANQTIQFEVVSGDPDQIFGVAGNQIFLQKSELVNFESKSSYVLNVRATDSFVPSASTMATITVQVQDANDAPAVASGSASIDENSATASFVYQAMASDEDQNASQAFTYRIAAGNVGDVFAIHPTTGAITVQGALDFESRSIYTLILEATETTANPLSGQGTVTIRVRDINEVPSVVTSSLSLNENLPANTIIGSVLGTDPDSGQSLTYSVIGGSAASRLTIDPSTGLVRTAFAGAFDFEQQSIWTLSVRVTDSASSPLSSSRDVTIQVQNVNDAPILLPQILTGPENATPAQSFGTVVASDQDQGQSISFAIVGGTDASSFAIHPTTGVVTLTATARLDFETKPTLNFEVEVSDSNNPAAKSRANITIQLTDANDAPTLNSKRVSLPENSLAGTNVTIISGSDQDVSESLTYLMDTNPNFEIDGPSGQVTVKAGAVLNFEQTANLVVPIRVRDRGGLESAATLTVDLTNVNEAPVAKKTLPNHQIPSGQSWSFTLPTGLFEDEDVGDVLRQVALSGSGFSLPSWIQYSSSTGVLTANPTIAQRGVHSFQIAGVDSGDLVARIPFTIEVLGNQWHNYTAREDVDGKGTVSPLDALLVLNYLNLGLDANGPKNGGSYLYYLDVNDDQFIAPLDALLVINYLNLRGSGEGEAIEETPATPDSTALAWSDWDATVDLLAQDRQRRRFR